MMRRGTYIAKEIYAANGLDSESKNALLNEKSTGSELKGPLINALKTMIKKIPSIAAAGNRKISQYMPLNAQSTVKDCIMALSLVAERSNISQVETTSVSQ